MEALGRVCAEIGRVRAAPGLGRGDAAWGPLLAAVHAAAGASGSGWDDEELRSPAGASAVRGLRDRFGMP